MSEIQKELLQKSGSPEPEESPDSVDAMADYNNDPEYRRAAGALIDEAQSHVFDAVSNPDSGVAYDETHDSITRPVTLEGARGVRYQINFEKDVFTVHEQFPDDESDGAPKRKPRKMVVTAKGVIVNEHHLPDALAAEQFVTDLTKAELMKLSEAAANDKSEKHEARMESVKTVASAAALAGAISVLGYASTVTPYIDLLSPGVSASPNHQDRHEQGQQWGDPIAEAQHAYDNGVKVTGVETAAIAQDDGRAVNGLKITLYEPHSRDAFNDNVKYGGTVAIVPHDAQHGGQDYWLNMAPDQRSTEDVADVTAEHVQATIPLEAKDVPQDGTRINLYATANAKDSRYPDKVFQALHYAGQVEVRHDVQNPSALTAQIVEADPNDTPQDALITAADPNYHGEPQPPLVMPGEAAPADAPVVNMYVPPLERDELPNP